MIVFDLYFGLLLGKRLSEFVFYLLPLGGGVFFSFTVAFSGFYPGLDGRRLLICSSFPVWSRSELVNVGFVPTICNLVSAVKAPARRGNMISNSEQPKTFEFRKPFLNS